MFSWYLFNMEDIFCSLKMDFPNKLVDVFLAKKMLHCGHCGELLRPPVMLAANLGNVCRTCYDEIKGEDNMVALENTLVSAILEEIEIPCEYKSQGCSMRIPYKELHEHKDECFYQTFACKAPVDCCWVGNLKNFICHYQAVHEDNHLQNTSDEFKLSEDLKELKEGVYLVKTSYGDLFLNVKRTGQDVKMFIHLISRKLRDLKYDFSVKFTGKNGNHISFNCRMVDWKPFFSDRYDESYDTPKINLESLNNMLQADTVSVTFILNNIDKFDTVGNTILEILKCDSCKLYPKYKMYSCHGGHKICIACSKGGTNCNQCYGRSNVFHVPFLDTIIKTVRLPCMFRDKGCIVKMPAYVDHDFACTYKEWNCSIGECTFLGYPSALINHIYLNHDKNYLNTSPTTIHSTQTRESYYMTLDNLLFHLIYEKTYDSSENCSFMWTMYIIGYREPHEYYYYYEIEFENGHRHIIFRAPCIYELETFKNIEKEVPTSSLSSFLQKPSKNIVERTTLKTNTIKITSDILDHINYKSQYVLEYEVRILKNQSIKYI